MASTQSLAVQKAASAGILAVGFALMVFCIYFESEPGALPLALVLVGSIWHVFTRRRLRMQN